MFTDAELAWYQYGCMIKQPTVEVNHPEVDVFHAMDDPPMVTSWPAAGTPGE